MDNGSCQFIGLPFLHTLCPIAKHKALFFLAALLLYTMNIVRDNLYKDFDIVQLG